MSSRARYTYRVSQKCLDNASAQPSELLDSWEFCFIIRRIELLYIIMYV